MTSAPSSQSFYLLPESRGVLAIAGDDKTEFLQGLVSNDVAKAGPAQALYSAFLTAQGKYLHDFFLAEAGGSFYIDCEAGRRDDLKRRLSLYKLRSKVTIADATASHAVALLFGGDVLTRLGLKPEPGSAKAFAGGVAYVDPRLAALGARAVLPREGAAATLQAAGFTAGDSATYDRLRMSQGVPDGSRDLPVEKAILLENGFDELHAIDWNKGCYLGQELTARTRYRGLVRKRLLPVTIDGPTPAPGTPVMLGDKEAGEMRSAIDGIGLALLRLEHVEGAPAPTLRAGEATLTAKKPDWVKLPET
ncbi:YgfZ/GcvT domain-containing protein [Hypericibacter sp.]|uniref:CAF17-like 4Fe-4S cluster assembly/insertion protein YgfZ n=1 Tax=Hypericibacter sp. TaxID=2705401 RepID=UPI003D6C97C7